MDRNVLTELVAHILVPFLAVVAVLIFRSATRAAPTWRETCNEVALEFAILGIGATGGVFLSPRMHDSGVYGILIVVLEMVFAAVIVSRGSKARVHAPSPAPPPILPTLGSRILDFFQGCFDLSLGFAPIMSGVVLFPSAFS